MVIERAGNGGDLRRLSFDLIRVFDKIHRFEQKAAALDNTEEDVPTLDFFTSCFRLSDGALRTNAVQSGRLGICYAISLPRRKVVSREAEVRKYDHQSSIV